MPPLCGISNDAAPESPSADAVKACRRVQLRAALGQFNPVSHLLFDPCNSITPDRSAECAGRYQDTSGRGQHGLDTGTCQQRIDPGAVVLTQRPVQVHPLVKKPVWCLQQLRGQFDALDADDRDRAQSLLQKHGCWEPLWRHPEFPVPAGLCSGLPFHADAKMIGVYE